MMSLEASTGRPRGKDRWNLLRDVHSLAKQARGTSSVSMREPTKPVMTSHRDGDGDRPKCLTAAVAAPMEPSPSLISPVLSEPAPEPGVEGEGILPEAELGGGEGEDFSELSEEIDAEETSALPLVAVPTVSVQKTQDENEESCSKVPAGRNDSTSKEKRALQVPSSLLAGSKSARQRLSDRRSCSKKPQRATPVASERKTMDPAASSTDMVTAVTSMVNSLAGLANFKLSTGNADSEDEVHNAWGENDTEENLLERVHDLELARGIALGPPQSAARLRRARKNKKEKPKEATATTCSSQDGAIGHLQGDLQEVHRQPAESNSDTFTAASSMMTTMFNSFATSVSFAATGKQDSEKELGASASSHAKEECSASTMEPAKVSMAVPMLQSQSTGRDRLARRKALQQHEATLVASERKTMDPAASSTDMVTSMVNSLAGLANFKLSTGNADSEGEVHNAWGENDTEENLLERVHDLELARGIALGPPQSAARLRRARKNKKEKPKEATATTCSSQDGAIGHLQGDLQEVHRQPAESNSDTFTAASSMMTTMFNSFATSVSFAATGKQDAEKELGASASSHAKEECSASTMEPAKVSMAVPMLQSQSAGRDRLARRRNRLAPPSTLSTDQQSSIISGSQGTESQCSMQSQAFSDTTSLGRQRARRNQHVSESIPQGEVLSSYSRSTFFGVAASSLAEFQRLFQSEVSEDGESYCIWGPDDTPERYEERLKALDRAREPASGMLHHRLMQRRKKRQGERKNQDTAEPTGGDPFLLM